MNKKLNEAAEKYAATMYPEYIEFVKQEFINILDSDAAKEYLYAQFQLEQEDKLLTKSCMELSETSLAKDWGLEQPQSQVSDGFSEEEIKSEKIGAFIKRFGEVVVEKTKYKELYEQECVNHGYTRFAWDATCAERDKLKSQVSDDKNKSKIVCFCGSTRFAEWFMIKRWELEKQGIITFGINILPNNYFAEGNAHGAEQEGVKEILDELHKRKIDLSDEVFILNVGGYIGESTRKELEYALLKGKPVKYLEPPISK